MSHFAMKIFAYSAAWTKAWMSLINESSIWWMAPFGAILTEDLFTDGTLFLIAIWIAKGLIKDSSKSQNL